MIAAGMGGGLVIRILSDSFDTASSLKELILQPQSEIASVRKYLYEQEYCIVEENMVLDDGKYYPMMKAVKCKKDEAISPYTEEELEYGRLLLKNAHPILKEYLKREIEIQTKILQTLENQKSDRARERMTEIQHRIEWIRKILEMYF